MFSSRVFYCETRTEMSCIPVSCFSLFSVPERSLFDSFVPSPSLSFNSLEAQTKRWCHGNIRDLEIVIRQECYSNDFGCTREVTDLKNEKRSVDNCVIYDGFRGFFPICLRYSYKSLFSTVILFLTALRPCRVYRNASSSTIAPPSLSPTRKEFQIQYISKL